MVPSDFVYKTPPMQVATESLSTERSSKSRAPAYCDDPAIDPCGSYARYYGISSFSPRSTTQISKLLITIHHNVENITYT